jgi:hypothetical protein
MSGRSGDPRRRPRTLAPRKLLTTHTSWLNDALVDADEETGEVL